MLPPKPLFSPSLTKVVMTAKSGCYLLEFIGVAARARKWRIAIIVADKPIAVSQRFQFRALH